MSPFPQSTSQGPAREQLPCSLEIPPGLNPGVFNSGHAPVMPPPLSSRESPWASSRSEGTTRCGGRLGRGLLWEGPLLRSSGVQGSGRQYGPNGLAQGACLLLAQLQTGIPAAIRWRCIFQAGMGGVGSLRTFLIRAASSCRKLQGKSVTPRQLGRARGLCSIPGQFGKGADLVPNSHLPSLAPTPTSLSPSFPPACPHVSRANQWRLGQETMSLR